MRTGLHTHLHSRPVSARRLMDAGFVIIFAAPPPPPRRRGRSSLAATLDLVYYWHLSYISKEKAAHGKVDAPSRWGEAGWGWGIRVMTPSP
ncbi:hypothetical protein EVAR_101043_1 [Eumeta japonica]|uniref:Uncharacterized protein n=1 Tax=Eumeta variegata TaxID=151549 RepID=A0A4C1SMH3_EUMVA|nr:hypothetical protein EVAR_101043_1 [Eumeta japonica]